MSSVTSRLLKFLEGVLFIVCTGFVFMALLGDEFNSFVQALELSERPAESSDASQHYDSCRDLLPNGYPNESRDEIADRYKNKLDYQMWLASRLCYTAVRDTDTTQPFGARNDLVWVCNDLADQDSDGRPVVSAPDTSMGTNSIEGARTSTRTSINRNGYDSEMSFIAVINGVPKKAFVADYTSGDIFGGGITAGVGIGGFIGWGNWNALHAQASGDIGPGGPAMRQLMMQFDVRDYLVAAGNAYVDTWQVYHYIHWPHR